jgi:3-deoxy-D-arabino-heptulosonate 7-phosphate (DAHP) synthase
MKGYKVEIIPNDNEDDIHDGLRIIARIIARKYLARQGMALADEVLDVEEGACVGQHV